MLNLLPQKKTAVTLCPIFVKSVLDYVSGSADRTMICRKRIEKLNLWFLNCRMLGIIPFMYGFWNQLLRTGNAGILIPWKCAQGVTPRILIIMIHLLAVWSFQEPIDETAKSAPIGSWKLPVVPFSDRKIIADFRVFDQNLPSCCKWRFFLKNMKPLR